MREAVRAMAKAPWPVQLQLLELSDEGAWQYMSETKRE